MAMYPKGSRKVDAWEKPFLNSLETGSTVAAARVKVRLAECQLRDKLKGDPAFKEKYDRAVERGSKSKIKTQLA